MAQEEVPELNIQLLQAILLQEPLDHNEQTIQIKAILLLTTMVEEIEVVVKA
jgi:hypothetical protein